MEIEILIEEPKKMSGKKANKVDPTKTKKVSGKEKVPAKQDQKEPIIAKVTAPETNPVELIKLKKKIEKKLVKILIIDDHQIVRDGVRAMLEIKKSKFKYKIFEADNGQDGISMIEEHDFDLLIVDYQLPKINGSEIVKAIKYKKPKMRILALSNYDEYHYIMNMLKAGANGFILKDIGPDELHKAVEYLLNGKNYYSHDVTEKIINFESPMETTDEDIYDEPLGLLTLREKEILQLIALEYTNREIAEKLNLNKRTIDTHRQNILDKLKVKNTVGLIKVATLLNLV